MAFRTAPLAGINQESNRPMTSKAGFTALFAAVLAVGCCCVSESFAADDFQPSYLPELTIEPAAGDITVDGRLDDAGWVGAAKVDGFSEHRPGDQTEPPVDTEVMIAYDQDNLYVAFVCRDDPTLVRATMAERDNIFRDDNVIVLIDTYGNQTSAYEIMANPYGVQGDLMWSPNVGEDTSFDMVYRADGQITDFGYVVEFAIPFSSLRFPDTADQVWRMDFWRNHPREVRGQYSWVGMNRDEPCWPCQWGTVYGISDVSPGKGLELLPSFVATQSGERDAAGDWKNADVDADVSLGMKYVLDSNMTAEATYNPDFSQVEADAAQMDVNTTFALSYEEKRPFFLEGSDLFQTYINTVYTRSINDPEFAAKLTGRQGGTSVAYLMARDEHTPYIVPFTERSEFAAGGRSISNILRVQQAMGEQSHLGFIATDRRLENSDGAGTVFGADGCIRLDQNHQFRFQTLASRTVEPDDPDISAGFDQQTFADGEHTAAFDGEDFWGYAYVAGFERQARRWSYSLNYTDYSPEFRAENGFINRNNRRWISVENEYMKYFDDGIIDWTQPSFNIARVWDYDGTIKDEWLTLDLSTQLKLAQTSFHMQYLRSNELFGGVHFDNIWALHLCGDTTPSDFLRFGWSLNYGERIARGDLVMGKEHSHYLWARIKPLSNLVIEPNIEYLRSRDVETDAELYKDYVMRTKFSLQLNRELAVRVVLQYRDHGRTWEADPLLTYRLNPFSIFYIGSTRDYRDLKVAQDGIDGWRLTNRQYFMKLQYLFQI